MNKKIIVLNGSPRANGNTVELVNAFKKGAESNGNSVKVFNLQKMDINPCLGCLCGGKDKSSPCVQKDDMAEIYKEYVDADIVVLASPLYFWNVSAQLKGAFDRLFAVAECNANYANPKKDAILIMAGEGNEFEESVYWYDRLMKHIGWTDIGKVLCGGVMVIGDINGKAELEQARILGMSI